ncbi:hypothetical protein PR202_gn00064 [Eleusine coracana subsp. coracana]|uniref:Uncharacterized protein n=1 Tax=Eleusine coracana subsp. coracana TaxID=191504 RepID=A0AAV5G0F9_ELECO|nr:hypothetical protein PR202_gb20061 [Eleusine coracana subsp. coracana]GJN40766.1 hypothetical protein PR202_gn00064 [Eleusine coracana subsp. coracana]
MATHLLPESAFVTDLDGAVIILKADDAAVEIGRLRHRVAKRARDEGPPLLEEGDACGWSSAVMERGLTLRRRRGPASCSRRGCGWVVGAASAAAEADEHNCYGKESTTSVALVAQSEIDKSHLAYMYLNVVYY